MKVIGLLIFTATLAYASARGSGNIKDEPICIEINGAFHHEFADPNYCDCFYECSWHDAISHCCPRDNLSPNCNGYLVYNPMTEVCDRMNAAINQGAICSLPGCP